MFDIFFVIVQIVDILCVILSILFEIQFLNSEVDDYEDVVESCQQEILVPSSAGVNSCDPDDMGKEFYDKAQHFVVVVSVVILGIFLLESFLLFIVKPLKFFMNKGRMFDLVVVVVALTLELFFEDSSVGGLVVVGRLWRFARIGHGVYVESKEECASCIENGKLMYQLESLNDSRELIKAYEMMLAGGGPETVDTELMDNLLHIVGEHLKEKEELALELMANEDGEDNQDSHYVPPAPKSNTLSSTMKLGGGDDVYTRM